MHKNERLRYARERAGYASSSAAARAMGIKVSTYTHHENGTRDFDDETAARYARMFRVSPEWLVFGSGQQETTQPPTGIVIAGDVRAGAWLEDEVNDLGDRDFLPLSPDPRFSRAPQIAYRVIGTSMNKVAQPGQFVIVASWPELGDELKDGDLVVVRRERAMTHEITLKRARLKNGEWQLWPESTDPRHQEPIELSDGGRDVVVSIIGKVIGKYEPM